MSSGVSSYPRTGAKWAAAAVLYRNAIDTLRDESAIDPEHTAEQLIEALQTLSTECSDHAIIISRAIETRNILFAKMEAETIIMPLYQKAMAICASHWSKANPLDSTGLKERIDAVVIKLHRAETRAEICAAKEEAGTIATLYWISAHLGKDISSSHLLPATPIDNSRYQATSNNGILTYLECGASYNVNQFVREIIPGCNQPLIIVGEAKGGKSGYGYVQGPKRYLHRSGLAKINQKDREYPVSRAQYMLSNRANTNVGIARREAGMAISTADKSERLVYVVARGDITNSTMSHSLEKFI